MKNLWKVLLTTTVVYFLYVLVGGCIFLFMEGFNELKITESATGKNTTLKFPEISSYLIDRNYTENQIEQIIIRWDAEEARQYFGSDDTVTFKDPSWTYYNAFFFAFYICTTIGYGDISPSTFYGHILAIVYAMIGIPLNILFYKVLGESFAQSYQETVYRIKGGDDSYKKSVLGNLGFFLPWTIVFFIIPTLIFMAIEDWNFIEGFYYSFITLSTVGLGDYIAGEGLYNTSYFTMYKVFILCWMIYGLAFFCMIIDYLTYLYQMHLLFEFRCTCRKCLLRFNRVYVDIEKLDVHFILLRAEGAKQKYTMYRIRDDTLLAFDFQSKHLSEMANLAEKSQGELLVQLQEYNSSREDAFPVKVPKDAFPEKDENEDTKKV